MGSGRKRSRGRCDERSPAYSTGRWRLLGHCRAFACLKAPKGEKRPVDVIANAVKVMRIAVGEVAGSIEKPKTPRASVASKGGSARAKKLNADRQAANSN